MTPELTGKERLAKRAGAQAAAYAKTEAETDKALADLLDYHDEHGGSLHDFASVIVGVGSHARGVIVRGPNRLQYKKIADAISPDIAVERGKEGVQIKPKSGEMSFNTIMLSGCVVWVSGMGLDVLGTHEYATIEGPINALVDRYPGAAELIKGKVSELADGNHAAIVGK